MTQLAYPIKPAGGEFTQDGESVMNTDPYKVGTHSVPPITTPTPTPAPTPVTSPPVVPPANQPTTPAPLFKEGEEVEIDSKVYRIDKEGNAIDAAGAKFKTKDELAALAIPTVTIDNVVYKLNDKGDAIAPDGSVAFPKAKLDEFAQQSDTASVEDVIRHFNYTPTSADGKPVTYSNDLDGIINYTKDYASFIESQAQVNGATSVLESHPAVARLYNHIMAHGTPEGFDLTYDPSTLKLDVANDDSVKRVIVADLKLKGFDDKSADTYYDFLKKEGKAVEAAKVAEAAITNHYKGIDEANKNQIAANQEAERKSRMSTWGVDVDEATGSYKDVNAPNSIYDKVVKTGKLSLKGETYTLPEQIKVPKSDGSYELIDRTDLFEYMFVPVQIPLQDGSIITATSFEIDQQLSENSKTVDDLIKEAFLHITKGDASQLLQATAKRKSFETMKRGATLRTGSPADNGGKKQIAYGVAINPNTNLQFT